MPCIDRVVIHFDRFLKTMTGTGSANRPYPADSVPETWLSKKHTRDSIGCMRVNHTGEICAQALYDAQACCAKTESIRHVLEHAGQEEEDHLHWCRKRLNELDGRISYLAPFWYGGAFLMGCVAAHVGDAFSLGFIEETEIQVHEHLHNHLHRLRHTDFRSCAIIQQMQKDEAQHAKQAQAHGAKALSTWMRVGMRWHARIMIAIAYWI